MEVMIYKQGNIVDFVEDAVAHGANCKATMKSGVAKALSQKFPELAKTDKGYTTPFYERLGKFSSCELNNGKRGYNIYTQYDYGTVQHRYVDYGATFNAFILVCEDMNSRGLKSLAIPRIGAGLGKGDWFLLEGIFELISIKYKIEVVCYDWS